MTTNTFQDNALPGLVRSGAVGAWEPAAAFSLLRRLKGARGTHAPATGGPGSVWDGHARGSGTGSLPSNSVINPKDQLSINFDVNFGNYNALSGSNVYKNYQLIVKTENTPLIYLSSKLTFGRV